MLRRIFVPGDTPPGFTLIELTIVLVIIAFIMGMVLKGKDLLRSAYKKKDFGYFQRLVEDLNHYAVLMLEKGGSEEIPGDSRVNGGVEAEVDGFVDVGGDSVETLLGVSMNYTDVYLFAGDYSKLADLLSVPSIDPSFKDAFGVDSRRGFSFSAKGGKRRGKIYLMLGADLGGAYSGNLVILRGISSDEAMSFDSMIDGVASGSKGDFLLLGYRVRSGCAVVPGDTCNCSGKVCVGKGIEGGCDYPLCSPEKFEEVICGYVLR